MKPKSLPAAAMDEMVRWVAFVRAADWLNACVVDDHPDTSVALAAHVRSLEAGEQVYLLSGDGRAVAYRFPSGE